MAVKYKNPLRHAGPINFVGNLSQNDAAGQLKYEIGQVAGNATTRILQDRKQDAIRDAVMIHNADSTYELWVLPWTGDVAPAATSATNRMFVIPAKQTLTLEFGTNVELYVTNSTGASTTSYYMAMEIKR